MSYQRQENRSIAAIGLFKELIGIGEEADKLDVTLKGEEGTC